MYKAEIRNRANPHKKTKGYCKGVGYWECVEASMDRVLGGYSHVNDVDVKCNEAFLKTLFYERFVDARRIQHLIALDCGSGIGELPVKLWPLESLCLRICTRQPTFIVFHFKDFTPKVGRYDVTWIQRCIRQLADDDFISFFKRAKVGLKLRGEAD
ncbi:Alpha N-terminal protein methyltransferase 1 [Vitis vinifera]|uniref:Alpha N-terminal protein methyltransferase 1 n=2 Tax=Vitis vinifera TaxID=29760 RepID=A0A438BXS7_VITVI|nr:Alpha N-terminal protein methyltransferase 1 [Vitis vinifera]